MEANLVMLLGGTLLFVGVLASTVSARLGMPVLLIFLAVGMLAGEEGPGGLAFSNFNLAFGVANLALAIILLDGGLRTQRSAFRLGLKPAALLATVGVLLTAGLVGMVATWALDLDWRFGLLLGAIVGSTDAAAVFNVLRNSGVRLNDRVTATLEIESGTNDPMAIFLVVMFITFISASGDFGLSGFARVLLEQFGLGVLLGLAGGWLLGALVARLRLPEGLYSLLIASGAVAIFAATTQFGGSGFLAVYLVGVMVAMRPQRATEHVLRAMDGLAWLAQAGMFLVLGLLVTPSKLMDNIWPAVGIAFFLMFVARPLAVWSTLWPFHFPKPEIWFISWVGLRGAVPIVLAVFPVVAGLPGALELFDVTFAVVLLSLLLQGSTIPLVGRWLEVVLPRRAEPLQRSELWYDARTSESMMQYEVEADSAADGHRADRLRVGGRSQPLSVLMVLRGSDRHLQPGSLRLQAGDRVYLLAGGIDEAQISEWFTRPHGTDKDQLSVRRFFGDFTVDPQAAVGDLADVYGQEVEPDERPQTVARYIEHSLARPPAEGDRVSLGLLELTVREVVAGHPVRIGVRVREPKGPRAARSG